jgi:hypothetical protein
MQDMNPLALCSEFVSELAGAVWAVVIDDEQVKVIVVSEQLGDRLTKILSLVVGRHNH